MNFLVALIKIILVSPDEDLLVAMTGQENWFLGWVDRQHNQKILEALEVLSYLLQSGDYNNL